MKRWLFLVLTAVFLMGCSKYEGYDKSDLKLGDIMLKSGGKKVFTYSEDDCQMSFNRGRKEFRAGTDNMSDYFVISLSSVPSSEMEVLTGSVRWTTSDDMENYENCTFKVVKMSDDGTVWLWCAKLKLAATIRIID